MVASQRATLIRGVPFWNLARAADFAVREWAEKGAAKYHSETAHSSRPTVFRVNHVDDAGTHARSPKDMPLNPRDFLTSGFGFCEWMLGLFCQYICKVIFAVCCPHIQDNIIRETANDPSTLGRADSVTVLLF